MELNINYAFLAYDSANITLDVDEYTAWCIKHKYNVEESLKNSDRLHFYIVEVLGLPKVSGIIGYGETITDLYDVTVLQ